MAKPRTLYDKIWDDHLVDEQLGQRAGLVDAPFHQGWRGSIRRIGARSTGRLPRARGLTLDQGQRAECGASGRGERTQRGRQRPVWDLVNGQDIRRQVAGQRRHVAQVE